MVDLTRLSNLNVGWFYLDALKAINARGKWPASLSNRDRYAIKHAGLVELKYKKAVQGGRQPHLTRLGLAVIS